MNAALTSLASHLSALESANDAFTRAVVDAFTALHEGMKSQGLTSIRLNGRVSFVGEGGDFHDEYVSVAINPDGDLVAVDSGGNETAWQSLENDTSHSILCLVAGANARYIANSVFGGDRSERKAPAETAESQVVGMKTPEILLHPSDLRFVRRLARAINRECCANGFYSSLGVTPEMKCGSRKFFGHVKVVKGRLMAREVAGDGRWSVDLTGATSVEGNGNGTVTARRHGPAVSRSHAPLTPP